MGFDHVGLSVNNFDAAVKFYSTILSPLGYKIITEIPTCAAGFGDQGVCLSSFSFDDFYFYY